MGWERGTLAIRPTRTARGARPPYRAGRVAIALFLLLFLLPRSAARAEPEPEPADPCHPLAAEPSDLPDLQQGAEALCRALWGDAPGGALSERLRLRIGGWADASVQDTTLSGESPSVALNHANLHLDARLDRRWQLFFEGEYEYEPGLGQRDRESEWELEQLYGEYRHADALRIQAGRFGTPFGIWIPIHWSILTDTIEAPIFEADRIVPEQQLGGRVHGSLFGGRSLGVESELTYSLYAGYGDDSLHTGEAEGATLGTDLRVRLASRHLLGVSLYTQRNGREDDRRERDLMLYGEVQLPLDLLLRSEYLVSWRDETRPGIARTADFVYAKLRWDFREDAYLNYRFEYGEDDRYGFTNDHIIHRFTLGYWPIPRIRLKAEYAYDHYDQRPPGSYHYWGVSAGVFF